MELRSRKLKVENTKRWLALTPSPPESWVELFMERFNKHFESESIIVTGLSQTVKVCTVFDFQKSFNMHPIFAK